MEPDIIIPNAHYFTTYDENNDGDIDFDEVYLVTIPGSGGNYELRYYQFINTDDNNNDDWNNDGVINMFDRDWKDDLDDGELIPLNASVPEDLVKIENIKPVRYKTVIEDGERQEVEVDDADELAFIVRQDFANWFSFYRRRMLTAKSAIGLTVYDMVNVELGLHGINHDVSEPLRLIDQPDSDVMMRYLEHVYDTDPVGNTPLREGLWEVGKYYDRYDTSDDSTLETSDGEICSDGSGDNSGADSVFYDAEREDDPDTALLEGDINTCDDIGGSCQRAYVIAMTDGYYNRNFTRVSGAKR